MLLSIVAMIIIRKGHQLTFAGRAHGSVGIAYRLECDECAFTIEESFRYLHPKDVAEGLCGSDEAVVTFVLTSSKCGMFRITEVEVFRGEVTQRNRHVVIVLP